MKKVVKFRADGGENIGFGHVVRCLALASMIKEYFAIEFYLLNYNEDIVNLIQESGFAAKYTSNEIEFLDQLDKGNVVVLDGYHFDLAYQKKVKETGAYLVFVDDMHNQHFVADLIINHAPGITADDYSVEPNTKLLLGPSYAMLRPEFLSAASKPGREIREVKEVMICFGGADPKNLTLKTLEALSDRNLNFTIVTGGGYSHYESLTPYQDKNNIKINRSLSGTEMLQQMLTSDLCVVPASGILFEAVAVGVPLISGCYIDNQRGIYEGFLKEKVFMDAGSFGEKEILAVMDQINEKSIANMLFHQAKCIDGKSGDRVLQALKVITI